MNTKGPNVTRRFSINIVVSALLLAAGTIHFIETPTHFAQDQMYGWFFVAMGSAQIIAAAAVFTHPSRRLLAIVMVGSIGIIGVWLLTRTVGIPIGAQASSIEAVGRPDLAAGVLEFVTAVLAAIILRHPSLGMSSPLLAIAIVGIGSGDAASVEAFAVSPVDHLSGESSHHRRPTGMGVSVPPTDDHPRIALFARVRARKVGSYFINGIRITYAYKGRTRSQVFASSVKHRGDWIFLNDDGSILLQSVTQSPREMSGPTSTS